MRIFFGLLFATFINMLMDIFGYLVVNSFISNYAPANVTDPTAQKLYLDIFLKFIVISTLAWIMYRVMTMLDTPKKKRVLFIFFIGTSLSIYSEVDLFWVKETYIWSLIIVLGQSTNWLLTGFVLSRFMRPRHLGAL